MALGKSLLSRTLILLSLMSLPAARAEDPYSAGTKDFGAKAYVKAAANFKKAIAANGSNDSARYYYALSLHYNKDLAGAKKAYAELIRLYPDSNGANYSRAALSTLDPALLKTLPPSRYVAVQQQQRQISSAIPSGSSSSSSSHSSSRTMFGHQDPDSRDTSRDHIPDECRIHFEVEHNLFLIDAYVNGRPMKMFFDTGAEGCAFGKNNLADAGVQGPTGNPTGMAHGVGSGGGQAVWDLNIDLKVGTIERRGFPVMVQSNMGGYPLLGQSFFQDFTYTIDNGAKSIHFVKKRKSSGSAYSDPSRDPYAVPFTRMGNELVVKVEVNGRPTTLFFDTGASIVSLNKAQVRQLGLTIPEDAEDIIVQGIAGSTHGKAFPVRSLRLGGIEKRDFMVNVVEHSGAPMGLLGQTFYNDMQYTIDYDRGYIHFMRR
jgi:clan AA aspartic protease (TIGR02281 family)